MAKINRLTPEQEAALPAYREEIRARALRGNWASDDEMRAIVVQMYVSAGLKAPTVMVFGDPVQCLWARAILRGKGQLGGQLRDQLGDQLGDQIRDQIRDQLWDQLRDQLRGQLRDQLGGQLGGQLRDQLRGQLGDQLWDQLGDQIRDQLGGQLWGQLGGQLRDAHDTLWFAGGSEFYWIAFYDFARQIGATYTPEQSARLDAWSRYAETCGPLYAYDGVAFVSRRPEVLQFDGAQRLHAEAGAAMAFASGYALHAWHGTRVPSHWIEDRANLKASEVMAERNVEVRMAGCQILGWAKVADQLDRKVIDGDPATDIGALVELTMPGLPEPGRFLMAQCPRNGTICEGVPRVSDIDGKPINTAIAAQAWRDSLPASEYSHASIRT